MKTAIGTLTFPYKIRIKTSFKNLSIRFVNGHIIKFNKTNLSIREPHKIIISNSYNTLIALLYCQKMTKKLIIKMKTKNKIQNNLNMKKAPIFIELPLSFNYYSLIY